MNALGAPLRSWLWVVALTASACRSTTPQPNTPATSGSDAVQAPAQPVGIAMPPQVLDEPISNHFNAHRVFIRTLKQWTRSAKIYRGLDNKLFVSATYHAPGFRRAFAVAVDVREGHGGKITRRELVDMTGGVEQHHNFFISVYTPDVRWNDLARDDSIWRMSLYGRSSDEETLGEAEVSPDDVVPIKVDENLRVVYPFISRFDHAYLVRFPLADRLHRPLVTNETDELVFRIASALGSATMRWPTQGLVEGSPPHIDIGAPNTP